MIASTEQIAGKKSRAKLPPALTPLVTRDEAENCLNELANAVNNKRLLAARLDASILKLKDNASPALAMCDESITERTDALKAWAEAHSEIFPTGRKSVEWPSGRFGFRIDPPSLALSNRKFGWAQILALVIKRSLRRFVRTKLEVDKDAILARCGTVAKPTKFQTRTLPNLGLKLVQEEQFFVEPDLTDVVL